MQPEDSPGPAAPRLRGGALDRWIAAGLVLFSLLFYVRVVDFDFVDFDDRTVLLGHPNLYGTEGPFTDNLREIFVDYFPREEPLVVRDVSWAVDARLFGFEEARGYHLGNVVLNALAVGLLFLFLRSVTDRAVAGWAALAFAVAPIHVEAVAWIMGRKDMLAACFGLAALVAQSRELRTERPGRRWGWWALGFVCCGLALGSKISAVAIVLALALHRLFLQYLERGADPTASVDARAALGRLPALVPHLVLTILVFAWYSRTLSEWGVLRSHGPGPLDPVHLGHVVRFLPLIAGEYLTHLAWPGELSMFYRWPHVEVPLTTAELLASAAWAFAGCAFLGGVLRRRRDLAFFALLALAWMAPYTGLFYVGFWHADRYFYVASAGVLVIAAIIVRDVARSVPRARPALAVLVAAFLISSAAQAWRQQEVWRDNESLWTYEAHRENPSLLSIQALAKHYVRLAEAEADPVRRAALVGQAEGLVERGIAHEAAMSRVPGPYHVAEQKHLARLHVLRGRLAALRGAPPHVQARHYRIAFDLAPERLSAIFLSRSLFRSAAHVAPGEQRPLVEASFDYFVHYLEYSANDPQWLEQGRRLLEFNYGERFPYLQARVERVRETMFP